MLQKHRVLKRETRIGSDACRAMSQTIENLGPLTKKRRETIDDESMAAAKEFITG